MPPWRFSSGFQEHFLLRLHSGMRKLIPSVLGELPLPYAGQSDIIFGQRASCDRVCKPQSGKCETSVSRNLTVHDICNKSEVI